MKKQTIIAIIFSAFVILAVNSPLIYFYLFPKNGMEFLGRGHINSQDVYTYVSFIEQAKRGAAVFQNLYTTEPQKPSLIRPSYFIIGQAAKITGVSSIAAYHVARIILSIIFCFALYRFLKHFFDKENELTTTFAMVLTASGLGFAVANFLPDSIDLWIPEAVTFLSLFEAPHFILSQILLLSGYIFFLEYLKNKSAQDLILLGLMFFALSFEHPFNLVTVVPTLSLTYFFSRKKLDPALLLAGVAAIGLVIQVILTITNPTLLSWQAQNNLPPPAPSAFLIGYGLITLLALVGIEEKMREGLYPQIKLLLTWIAVTFVLAFSPINFSRRLLEGVHVPIAILASIGLSATLIKFGKDSRKAVAFIIICVLSLSSVYAIFKNFEVINQDVKDNYYYHITKEEAKAIEWLGENSAPNDIIL